MQYASMISVESPAVVVTRRSGSVRTRLAGAGVALAAALLSACSGGSGADVEQKPGLPNTGPTTNYNGPAPSTPDVQQFKINLWDNIQANNRCGTCHSDTGGQAPMFARRDDINLAYAAANGVVTLVSPARLDDGQQGRRRPQLLAREQRRVRRHLDDVDHELGRRDGFDGRAQDRARAAGAPRPRPEQELPGRPGRVVLDDRVSAARADNCSECHASNTALKQQPFFAETDGPPIDRGRRRARLRGRQVEDESRRPVALALRAAAAQRVAQLLDVELRQRCERDADRDPELRQRRGRRRPWIPT